MSIKNLVLGLALVSINVMADPWSDPSEILMVYPHTGGISFTSSYANTYLSSCDEGKRFSISITHDNYEVMASTLLAAFAAGKQVKFNIDSDQDKNCSPTINRFYVYK